ncbi:MAG: DUF2341 domain-containing protein [Candidatus Methanoperedens sp.]|nr:DUF2341 domain-containing protein [Candidatus Methanoperedens sp.]
MNKDGEIELLHNNYKPQININISNKKISKDESISTAIKHLKLNSIVEAGINAELVVYPKENSYYLAWKVLIPAYEPLGYWLTFIDATNGNILDQFNLIKFADGWGYVFDPDPVVTSGNNTLRDNNNSDNDILTQQRFNRTLKDLDGSGNLTGPYVDLTAPRIMGYKPAGLTNETSLHFNYTRSDDRFEEVNIYYHIDKFQRYIQSLGFTNVNNRPIPVHAHYQSSDNSFYWSADRGLHFGDGGVDDAEDADIILHEYGHAIQDDQVPGFGAAAETGAMGEGFGDYIAASFFSAVNNGFQRACVGDWDATSYSASNPPCTRRVDGQKHYPEDIVNEVHDDGEIWSASLWDIWLLLGATVTDKIAIEGNFYLSPNSNFNDGANAIVLADRNLYGGAHVSSIETVFKNRGIFPNNSDFLSGGWFYRKQKNITGSTAGAQTNYQMKLTIYNSSGTDTPGNIYLGGNAKSDFSDLRFTKSDGVTLLDYWIESYTPGVNATVWVEVDSIPASPNTASIYLYYGNSFASSSSNIHNTFLFGDNFEDSSWTANNWNLFTGGYTLVSATQRDGSTGNVLKSNNNSGQTHIIANVAADNIVIEANVKPLYDAGGTINYGVTFRDSSNLNTVNYFKLEYLNWGPAGHNLHYVGCAPETRLTGIGWTINNWYMLQAQISGSSLVMKLYDRNGNLIQTIPKTASCSLTNTWLGIYSGDYSGNTAYYDAFRVRKYVSPEPAWGS